MQGKFLKTMILVALALTTQDAYSRKFANQFIEFELPPRWECGLEGKEWVCQSRDKKKRHEAIIVLAAKIKGRQDSLDQYKAYLQRQKTFTLPGGKANQSDPKYTKYMRIKNHPWVDSLHLASEIPGFYTRYLATVKETIGVLLTFSVAKHKYNHYRPLIDQLVASLKVFKPKGGLDQYKPKKNRLAINIPKNFGGGGVEIPDGPVANSNSSEGDEDMAFLLILGLGVVGFIIYKKKRG